ncbi:hypothetical protein KBT16_29990 [Nostoc sp. CCCryo 231-06]|nr:hypothetical protein [Nostoc sp. CCCryo 231-06]
MQALGREGQGSGCIYFTGGASALLIGWRSSTIDVDIRLDPEPLGIFQAIPKSCCAIAQYPFSCASLTIINCDRASADLSVRY